MKQCVIINCKGNHKALGYCAKHYKRVLRYGDPFCTKRHGMYSTPIYQVWQSMKKRCYNSNCKDYKDYGGRGIIVCDRWLNSFENFYEDMGDKPFPKAQLDREKNNEDYTPDNCRWVTNTVNQQNRRNNVFTKETVKLARQMYEQSNFTRKQLQKIFKVDYANLCYVLRHDTWRNIL